jgi:hypothetical protein
MTRYGRESRLLLESFIVLDLNSVTAERMA